MGLLGDLAALGIRFLGFFSPISGFWGARFTVLRLSAFRLRSLGFRGLCSYS